MDRSKRDFMSAVLPLTLAVPLTFISIDGFAQEREMGPRQHMPSRTNDPTQNDAPKIDPKLIQQQNQKKIQQDIQKLYVLAGELKEQVEKTDSTNMLSLSLVEKAKEIEKLAKQIANLARG